MVGPQVAGGFEMENRSAMRQALADKLAHSQVIIEKLRQQGEVARTALSKASPCAAIRVARS